MNSEKAFASFTLKNNFSRNILSNRIYFVNFLPKVELQKWFSCRDTSVLYRAFTNKSGSRT